MNDNRQELINALSVGDVDKVKRLKEDEDQSHQGKMLMAVLNKDEDTWHILMLGMYQRAGQWFESEKFKRVSYESFAKLICRFDYQVILSGYLVNHKFPEHSDAYVPPDPKMTPERKYQEILQDLKDIAAELRLEKQPIVMDH